MKLNQTKTNQQSSTYKLEANNTLMLDILLIDNNNTLEFEV